MKRTLLLLIVLLALNVNAQSWDLTGNSGTNPTINFIGTLDNQDLVFKTFGNEKMRIARNGKVYIANIDPNQSKSETKVIIGTLNDLSNCTSCNGYNLFVKNGIKTEKIKVEFANVNGWADYVFEKDYKLMPLKDMKNFITENRHLPEVPTAKEVVENGLELKEFSALLLKKVEELTLHIIQLNDTIEQQNLRIKYLENKKQ